MATVGIPAAHRATFARLATFPEELFRRLLVPLTQPQTSLSRPRFVEAVERDLAVSDGEARLLVDALIGAHHIRRWRSLTSEAAADLLSSADELLLEAPERSRLRALLVEALSSEPLAVMAKAIDVLTEHEHVLHEARVVTDMRPVFGASAGDPPSAWVLVQTLKIDYHAEGRRRDFFVAMDMTDLRKLRAVLDRAIEKAQSVERVMEGPSLSIVEIGGES